MIRLLSRREISVAVSSVDFTSMPTTFSMLLLSISQLTVSQNSDIALRFSNNGGSSFNMASTHYNYGTIFRDEAVATVDIRSQGNSLLSLTDLSQNAGINVNFPGMIFTIWLSNWAKVKETLTWWEYSIRRNSSLNESYGFGGGSENVPSTVNAFQVFATPGNIKGIFSLYGIK